MQKKFTDCTLIFQDAQLNKDTIDVHRVILAQRSPYFEKLFSGDFQESTQSKVTLQVEDIGTAKQLINWFYQPVDYKFITDTSLQELADMWLLRPKECSHYEIETDKYWHLLHLCIDLLETCFDSNAMDMGMESSIIDHSKVEVERFVGKLMSNYIKIFGITPQDFGAKHFCPTNLYDNPTVPIGDYFKSLINKFIERIGLDNDELDMLFNNVILNYLFSTYNPYKYFIESTKIRDSHPVPGMKQLGDSDWYVYCNLLVTKAQISSGSETIHVAVKSISRVGSSYMLNNLTSEDKELARKVGLYVVKDDSEMKFMGTFSLHLLDQIPDS